MLSNDEVDKRLDEAEGSEDYLNLYKDMFGEEMPVVTWGDFPTEIIVDAVLSKKPIKPNKEYEEGKIVF